MKSFVEKYELLNKIKDAMQWHEALHKKAELKIKWYHTIFAPFSKVISASHRAEWRLEVLESLLQQVGISTVQVVELDWYEVDLIYNLKDFEKFLEES